MIFSKCCNYIYRFFFADSLSGDTCSVFEFDMVEQGDRILSITYNNGTQVIEPLSIRLDNTVTETDISNQIKAALNTVPITYEDVTVERTDIGGDLFSYIITFINPSMDIGVLDISGNGTASTTTDCT